MKRTYKRLLVAFIFIVCVSCLVAVKNPQKGLATFIGLTLLIPVIALTFTAPLVFHELGHYLAGRLVGFRFVLFQIGPMQWVNRQGKLRFNYLRSSKLSGGFVSMVPPESGKTTKRSWALFILGGPLFSLAYFVIMMELYVSFGKAAAKAGFISPLHMFFLYGFVMALVVLLASCVPYQGQGFLSDGAQLLRMRRDPLFLEVITTSTSIQALAMSGMRDADLPEDLVNRYTEIARSDIERVHANFVAAARSAGVGELAAAHAYAEKSVSLMPANLAHAQLKQAVLYQAARLRSHHAKDVQGARELLDQEPLPENNCKYLYHYALVRIAWALGDIDAIQKEIELTKQWYVQEYPVETEGGKALLEGLDRLKAESFQSAATQSP